MNIVSKLKETLVSVVPIIAVVIVLNFTIAPIGNALGPFFVGSVLLIIGLSIFLTGTELGMTPIGEMLGSVLTHKKNTLLMLSIGFIIGFAITFAEPDVNVLASQVHSLNPSVNETALAFFIAVGLGVFVDIGLVRTLRNTRLRKILVFFYLLVFIVVTRAGQKMASIAFDASGATTGPLAVPFLLALGLGVSSSSAGGEDNSFGLTGTASIGPIIAVGLMAVLSSGGNSQSVVQDSGAEQVVHSLGSVIVQMTAKTARGFFPLASIIAILQLSLLHFPKEKLRRIVIGIVYSFVGIVLFLSGVEYGFTSVGRLLGQIISTNYPAWVSVAIAVVLGAIVVCAEPAVWVLTHQVEEVTAGRIKRSLVMIFLCTGVASAVGLAVLRIILNINYLWFVYIGVGSALVLTFFCPPLFTGIAFDSGGVASGPMSTTFLLSFALGISGSADMGFGLVGLIAIAPLIAVQILGVIFSIKEKKIKSKEGN